MLTKPTLPPVLDLPELLTTFEEPEGPATADKMRTILWLPLWTGADPSLLDAALDLANAVRKAIGLPPVTVLKAGHKGSSQHCVIAETILDGYDGSRGSVAVGGSATHVGADTYDHPTKVTKFISAFDGGNLELLSKG